MAWLQSFDGKQSRPIPSFTRPSSDDVDRLIEAAKRDAYTVRHGETKPISSLIGKEDLDGAV